MSGSKRWKRPRGQAAGEVEREPAPAAAPGRSQAEAVDRAIEENLSVVRDILFGQELRLVEERIEQAEERLARELAAMRAEGKERHAELERFVHEEIARAVELANKERAERCHAYDELKSGFDAANQSFQARLRKLDEQLEKSGRELRQALLAEAAELREALAAQRRDLEARLDASRERLGAEKASRATLAALLQDLALGLAADSDHSDRAPSSTPRG